MVLLTPSSLPLQGLGIVVTRAAHQAEPLCRLIEVQGGIAIRFPTLEILPPRDFQAVYEIIGRLDDFAMAVFVSVNAVSRGMALIQARCGGLPPHLKRVAIGKGSARELARWGTPAHLVPERFNSESLLAMAEMQRLAGQRIVIFRGEGGRELLADTLKARGAQVKYAEVYRRGKPAIDPGVLLQRWARGEIHAIIVTSNESLRNLFDIISEFGQQFGQQWLCNTCLIVVSERARELAQKLGFKHSTLVAREASNEAIVDTLLRWRQAPSE